ncbi:MAG: nitrogen assimilation transcriptional regulator NAC [Methylobacteriaceae bacterium]|nr:nitrogen assimilation transcriptional regulator NAC [Methylobacteriaceae bacterium]
MDTRRLGAFVKIVDTGSLTRAADNLRVAQPALSQQVAALEAHFGQRLLIRSKRGVTPTEAGRALYRHAQVILRQLGLAEADVGQSTRAVVGSVSLGLAPYSAGSALALPLLRLARQRHPGVVLHINENFGGVISEMVMTGRMDLAVIYQPGPIRGVAFEPMFEEELFLVSTRRHGPARSKETPLAALAGVPLLLPSKIHTIRRLVDAAFERAGIAANLVAEIESAATLAQAIDAGLGATILPWSPASAIAEHQRRSGGRDLVLSRLVRPSLQARVSICTPDHIALSEAAQAVLGLIRELIDKRPPGPERPGAVSPANTAARQPARVRNDEKPLGESIG